MNDKYFPLNEVQFKELKEKMSSIAMHLPENMLNYVWNNYKLVTGSIENQPCSCASAAGLWIKAVNALKDYIKRMDSI